MSFIDKIKVKNTLYDIQDTNSREILDIITPKNVASGRLLHFTDGLPLATFENKISGNVEQETTKGNQLLDFSVQNGQRTTFTFENDILTINADGTITYQTYSKDITSLIKNNQGKSVSFNFENFEFATNHNASFVQINIYHNDGTNISYNSLLGASLVKHKYNIPSDTSNIESAQFIIYLSAATTMENTITITKPMLTFDENAEYEPYTGGQASPNPEYKQDIEVIEGDLSYKVNGKNLLPNTSSSKTINGITFTKNENGSITINGTSTSVVKYDICTSGEIQLESGTYILSSVNAIPSSMWFTFNNDNKDVLALTNKNSGTFTLTENSVNGMAYIYINKGVTLNNLTIYPMISLEGGEYEPYQEQITTLDLKGNFVGKISDTIKDYVITDKKKYWLVKNVGKVVLDGSEDWTVALNENNTNRFSVKGIDFRTTNSYDDIPPFINNHFQLKGFGYVYNKGIECISWWFSDTTKSLVLCFGDNKSLEELKQWLSENNVEMYYQLATPQIIELDILEEPIKTFEGTNNIQVIANIDTDIEVKYAVDIKKYTDNKLAEISSQII